MSLTVALVLFLPPLSVTLLLVALLVGALLLPPSVAPLLQAVTCELCQQGDRPTFGVVLDQSADAAAAILRPRAPLRALSRAPAPQETIRWANHQPARAMSFGCDPKVGHQDCWAHRALQAPPMGALPSLSKVGLGVWETVVRVER